MSDETRLRQDHSRGERARRIMDDDLVKETFAKIEEQILDAWKESQAHESEQRHNAYLMLRLFKNFRAEFERAMATGNAAGKELLRIQEESKLKRLINGRR